MVKNIALPDFEKNHRYCLRARSKITIILGLDHPFDQMVRCKDLQASCHSGVRRDDVVAETMIKAKFYY